jgi:hypothetical protein
VNHRGPDHDGPDTRDRGRLTTNELACDRWRDGTYERVEGSRRALPTRRPRTRKTSHESRRHRPHDPASRPCRPRPAAPRPDGHAVYILPRLRVPDQDPHGGVRQTRTTRQCLHHGRI